MAIGVWVVAAALVLFVGFGVALVIGYSSSKAGPHYPTTKCLAAFDRASDQLEEHYATHPGAVKDFPTDEELNAENAAYEAIIDPLYDACTGVNDFYQAAYDQGDRADWSLHGTAAISDEELRDIFISVYCSGRTNRSSCSDYVEEG